MAVVPAGTAGGGAGHGVPSGIYFVSLRAEGVRMSRRIVRVG